MNKIKKGDEVIIIAGKDKGKSGTILSVLDNGERLIVGGVNTVKKCVKGNPQSGEVGSIIDKDMPIHRSNVMIRDPQTNTPSRVGIRTLEDGQRVRYFKKSNQTVDIK